jgi:DNA invertase Pin-like site-specific DNA recombinase
VLACSSVCRFIDATTPAGTLEMHILGAIAQFEGVRIREPVVTGLRRWGLETRKKQ